MLDVLNVIQCSRIPSQGRIAIRCHKHLPIALRYKTAVIIVDSLAATIETLNAGKAQFSMKV